MGTREKGATRQSIDLVLRPPTAEDLEQIRAGWEKAVPHDELGNWWRQDSDLVLPAKKAGLAAVATSGSAIVGFVSAINRALCAIYVQEDCRRQGIGTALLHRVVAHGKKKTPPPSKSPPRRVKSRPPSSF